MTVKECSILCIACCINVTQSWFLVSDGASISGAVSTVHCYRKHLSESTLRIENQTFEILSEENCMELSTFSSLSQTLRYKLRYPCIQLVLSLIFSMHVKN